jgi:hypothetical protein
VILVWIVLTYSWVDESFRANFVEPGEIKAFRTSLDGHHWGVVASVGATVKCPRFILEPFLSGGYQKLNLKGKGFEPIEFNDPDRMDKLRKDWFFSGGFSIKF